MDTPDERGRQANSFRRLLLRRHLARPEQATKTRPPADVRAPPPPPPPLPAGTRAGPPGRHQRRTAMQPRSGDGSCNPRARRGGAGPQRTRRRRGGGKVRAACGQPHHGRAVVCARAACIAHTGSPPLCSRREPPPERGLPGNPRLLTSPRCTALFASNYCTCMSSMHVCTHVRACSKVFSWVDSMSDVAQCPYKY